MPGSIRSVLQVFTNISIKRIYHYPFLLYGSRNRGTKKLSELPKVTELVCGRGKPRSSGSESLGCLTHRCLRDKGLVPHICYIFLKKIYLFI